MKFYNGLQRENVLEIHSFVMRKRRELYYGQRKLAKLVEETFGVKISENTIANWIFLKVFPFANEKTQFTAKPRPLKKELYNLYTKQMGSAQTLAKKYNVSTVTFINWLRAVGISPRTHTESMNTESLKHQLREKKLKRPTKPFNKMTPEKAYIFGVLCGDGYISKMLVRLEIRYDEDFIKTFVHCFEKVYGLKHNYRYYKPKNTLVTEINSMIIAQDLATYGNFRTTTWSVPSEIIKSNDERVIGSFLRGYYDSEGTVSRSTISCSSINQRGLRQIQQLLLKLGIRTTLSSYENCSVVFIFRKGRFRIFKDKVGFSIKRKLERVNENLNTGFFSKRSVAI